MGSKGCAMYKGCMRKRNRLVNVERKGVVPNPGQILLDKGQQYDVKKYPDQKCLKMMFKTNVIRWMFGICCLFQLFPGTYKQG